MRLQRYVPWKPTHSGAWSQQIDGAYGVIHLAGGPLFTFGKRHDKASVRQETHDRILAIQGLVVAMEAATVKPTVFISASSVGAYGYRGFTDEVWTENHPPGTDFWGQTARNGKEQRWRQSVWVCGPFSYGPAMFWMQLRREGWRGRQHNFDEALVVRSCPGGNGCPGFTWPMKSG